MHDHAARRLRSKFIRYVATVRKRGYYSRDAGFMPLGDSSTYYFPAAKRHRRMISAMLTSLVATAAVAIGAVSIMGLRLAVQDEV